MIPLFFFAPEAIAFDAQVPPPPLWWTLALAGAAAVATALTWALS